MVLFITLIYLFEIKNLFSHYLKKAQSLNPELNAVVRFFDQKVPADIAQRPLA